MLVFAYNIFSFRHEASQCHGVVMKRTELEPRA